MSNKDHFNSGKPPPDGDKNYAGILIGVNWAVFSPATILVALRVYTRLKISHNIGWDDAMIVLAQAVNAVGMGFVMLEIQFGLGRHKYFINPDHEMGFLKYNFLDWNQVFITLCVSKIAICMFLLRISIFAKWRVFLYGVIAFLVATHLPLELLFLLQCIPLNKNWEQQIPGSCFSLVTVEKIIIVQGVFSILTDVVLAAFPFLLLWNMRLPKRQKIQLDCLLGLGIVTAMTCIVRTVFSYEIKQPDITWQGVPNAICRMLEVNFGIIAACMPMMRTLLISMKKRRQSRGSERLTSSHIPASQLQWYNPPTERPWYSRIKRSLWQPHPTTDMISDLHASDSDRSPTRPYKGNEQVPKPPILRRRSTSWPIPKPPILRRRSSSRPIPQTHPPLNRGKSPKYDERPENATWAENRTLSEVDSIDLPIQGARHRDWDDQEEDEKGSEQDPGSGTKRYHRHWV